MDTAKELTHISLCTGYGGIDLGLKRAIGKVRTVTYVEIEAFVIENLVSKIEAGYLDAAPIFTDLKQFPWRKFAGRVDILSGGFPCQPFSSAGTKNADADPRHLWPYITKGIVELGRPPIVFFENVEGILASNLKGESWTDPQGTPILLHILRELERLGYYATASLFSASEIGAPHQRKRLFILGVRHALKKDFWDSLQSFISESTNPIASHETLADSEGFRSQRKPSTMVKAEAEAKRQDDGSVSNCSSSVANELLEQISSKREYSSNLPRDHQLAPTPNFSAQALGNPKHNGLSPSKVRRGDDTPTHNSSQGEDSACESKGAGDSLQMLSTAYPAPRGCEQSWWEPPRVLSSTNLQLANALRKGFQRQESQPKSSSREARRIASNNCQSRKCDLPKYFDQDKSEPVNLPRKCDTFFERECAPKYLSRGAESSVGRSDDGDSDWLDYAHLCESVDNKTDELRLLGNGVVPDTASKAFKELFHRLYTYVWE